MDQLKVGSINYDRAVMATGSHGLDTFWCIAAFHRHIMELASGVSGIWVAPLVTVIGLGLVTLQHAASSTARTSTR
jgi:hypothetical protein